ncbi:MAG: Imidazolonepropionase [Phycisphaerae bacterium]|nr:Imidazolonepropionase [Phycisphaerae bacterium]
MRGLRAAALLLSPLCLLAASPRAALAGEAAGVAYRVGKVITMDKSDAVINGAVVLVAGGKIEAVGPAASVRIPENYRVVEFPDRWLVPGLVDCHNHIAGSLGDLNDSVYLTNPGLNSRQTVEPNNDNVKNARGGGVTSALLIPGSGTNMSGFGTICKMGGDSLSEVIVRSPGSLKIAQAGNPEWYWVGVGRSFMNWNTRQTLEKARDYNERWEQFDKGETKEKPEFNPIWDQFRGLFRREFPVSVHSQGYQLLMTTIDMLAKKLKLWVVLDHSEFDGWKTAALVKDSDVFTVQGPRSYHFERTCRKMIGNAAGWYYNGVTELGINTDSPVVPQEELTLQAALGCWYGWLPYPALRGVTIVPARALGIDQRVGSIEAGKDADFGIWTGDPIDPRSACLLTVVNGKVVYDVNKKPRPF